MGILFMSCAFLMNMLVNSITNTLSASKQGHQGKMGLGTASIFGRECLRTSSWKLRALGPTPWSSKQAKYSDHVNLWQNLQNFHNYSIAFTLGDYLAFKCRTYPLPIVIMSCFVLQDFGKLITSCNHIFETICDKTVANVFSLVEDKNTHALRAH